MNEHWPAIYWYDDSDGLPPPGPALTVERLSVSSLRVKAGADTGTGGSHWRAAQWATGWSYHVALEWRFAGPEQEADVVPNAWASFTGLRPSAEYLVWAAGRLGNYYTAPAYLCVTLASADTVLAAVKRAFANSPAAQLALPGGLWANEVPEEVDLPYGYVELLGSKYLWTSTDFHVEVATVCLHVYASGAENCEAATRQVRQAFDWQDDIPFAADDEHSSLCQMMPTDTSVQSEFAKLGDGTVVYQARVEYEMAVNRDQLVA